MQLIFTCLQYLYNDDQTILPLHLPLPRYKNIVIHVKDKSQ